MAFRSANLDHVAKFNSATAYKLLKAYNDQVDLDIKEKSEKKPHCTFAPSGLRCERRSWFRLRGVDPDKLDSTDARLEFSAEIGTACHTIIQERLIRALNQSDDVEWVDVTWYLENVLGLVHNVDFFATKNGYETQVEFFNIPVRFAVDGILKIGSEYYLFEIKSSEYASWNDLTDPKSEHVAQAQSYCTLLNLSKVIFFYIDRQYGDIKSYELAVSEDVKQSMLDMFDRVQKYAEFGIAPDPLPRGDKWCTPTYCPYYKKCSEYGR